MNYLDKRKLDETVTSVLPETIFDPEAIASIQQLQLPNGPDILEQFMQLFLKTSKELMSDFKIGLEERDLKKISFSLHTLKSSTASLGASKLTDLCVRIETAALTSDADAVYAQAGDLIAQFEAIEVILAQYMMNKKTLISE